MPDYEMLRNVLHFAERTAGGVIPEVTGMAYRVGRSEFELDPGDPLADGFSLR